MDTAFVVAGVSLTGLVTMAIRAARAERDLYRAWGRERALVEQALECLREGPGKQSRPDTAQLRLRRALEIPDPKGPVS